MQVPSDEFITQSAELARERLLGKTQRTPATDSGGYAPQSAVGAGGSPGLRIAGILMAISLAALLGGVALPHLAGPGLDDQTALRNAHREANELRSKLDKWMMSAAQREEEVRAQLHSREREIGDLKRRMSADDLEAAPSARLSERLTILQTERSELARTLTSTRQALFDTKEALAQERARASRSAEDDRQTQGTLQQELAARQQALSEQTEANSNLKERLLEIEGELAERDNELDDMQRILSTQRRSHGDDDLAALRAAAGAAVTQLKALAGELPGDHLTRVALLGLREQATSQLFDHQTRLVKLSGAAGLYTIKESDTLTGIASRVLGDTDRWLELYEANRHILDSPDRIGTGLPLILPAAATDSVSSVSAPPPPLDAS
jgi:nucleoid-associated protein YgaU